MRDILLRVKTRDLQAVHEALAREFLERGERREYLFSPAELPDGEFGAWVRVNNEDDSRGPRSGHPRRWRRNGVFPARLCRRKGAGRKETRLSRRNQI